MLNLVMMLVDHSVKPDTIVIVDHYGDVYDISSRAATREELYRRLYLAKEYADALFGTAITVNEMADVAGLSVNHFLRTFKQVFHQSPYQYITLRRFEHAQYLLRYTNQSVTEICFAAGFESLGAFSWRFRQRMGVSPQMYRRQTR